MPGLPPSTHMTLDTNSFPTPFIGIALNSILVTTTQFYLLCTPTAHPTAQGTPGMGLTGATGRISRRPGEPGGTG